MTEAPPFVTIVMYHFVRPVAASRYPRLAALELAGFHEQLRYVRRHYSPIRLCDVIAAAEGARTLPSRPIVLTFDDGYRDHYQHVFPVLADERMPAAFFPIRAALVDRTALDANKIQFVLAAVDDPERVAGEIDAVIESSRDPALRPVAEYHATWWKGSRFDGPAVVYVKRMLQHALPDAVRRPLVDTLFHRHVTTDDAAFAADLYFTTDEARQMHEAGMEFGGHGDRHIPLPALGREEQAKEIDGALAALDAIGVPRRPFAYSYVKGEYNEISVDLLRERGCALAVTTRVDLARPRVGEMLALPRLATNDLPAAVDAPPNDWTRKVLN